MGTERPREGSARLSLDTEPWLSCSLPGPGRFWRSSVAWSGGGVGGRMDWAGHLLAEGPGASHFLSLNYFQGLGMKQAANNANHSDDGGDG